MGDLSCSGSVRHGSLSFLMLVLLLAIVNVTAVKPRWSLSLTVERGLLDGCASPLRMETLAAVASWKSVVVVVVAVPLTCLLPRQERRFDHLSRSLLLLLIAQAEERVFRFWNSIRSETDMCNARCPFHACRALGRTGCGPGLGSGRDVCCVLLAIARSNNRGWTRNNECELSPRGGEES